MIKFYQFAIFIIILFFSCQTNFQTKDKSEKNSYKENIAYLYALSIEKKVLKAINKKELERVIIFYSKKEIKPENSLWGDQYILKDNEKMIQYLIMEYAQLDVVFNVKDEIIRIFTSYE